MYSSLYNYSTLQVFAVFLSIDDTMVEKIRMNIIICSLGRILETIKKDLPLKKLFRSLCANAIIYKNL